MTGLLRSLLAVFCLSAACSIDPIDYTGKDCPCPEPWICVDESCQRGIDASLDAVVLDGGMDAAPDADFDASLEAGFDAGPDCVPVVVPRRMCAGEDHTCIIRSDGSLWCWGGAGLTGVGPTSLFPGPPNLVEVPSDGDAGTAVGWATIDCGDRHTCATTMSGRLYCWGGESDDGRLGIGVSMGSVVLPTQVGTNSDWAQVGAGFTHSCGIRSSGEASCWGANQFRQFPADVSGSEIPLMIPNPAAGGEWVWIEAAAHHTCAIDSSGQMTCWGCTAGYDDESETPPCPQFFPSGIPTLEFPGLCYSRVFASTNACVLDASGALSCWGDAAEGQTGVGCMALDAGVDAAVMPDVAAPTSVGDGVVSVALGIDHGCMVTSDTQLWCWGVQSYVDGLAGNPSFTAYPLTADPCVPQRITLPIEGGETGWKEVVAGRMHTCALRSDDTVWCMGDNTAGQSGLSTPGSYPPRNVAEFREVIFGE